MTAYPTDLVASFDGDACCGDGTIWLAPLMDVVDAARGKAPLIAPCCGKSLGIDDVCKVAFFSRAEWEATGDDDDAPQSYFVDHIEFRDGGDPPPCAGTCDAFLAGELAEKSIEAHVSHLPPLVDSIHPAFNLICPHGFKWWAAPTSEQIAQWVEDGIE